MVGCSMELPNVGLRFNINHHISKTSTTCVNQIRIRSPSLNVKHHRVTRRVSCSAVDEEQIQEVAFSDAEKSLISSLIGIEGRGRTASPRQLKEIEQAVKVLEDTTGVPDPTSSSLIEGRWQSVFITRPGTSSPIQRTLSGVNSFGIFQEIYLRSNDPRVSNIVKFSDAVGELKVEAAATIKDGKRILFGFDRAAFSFKFLPFKVPYPVPFRLLGEKANGWLDTTYLSKSGNLRISRGNRGSTFILQKQIDRRQRLLSTISSGSSINEVQFQIFEEFVSKNVTNEEQLLVEGEWQMIWSSQMETDSWIENAANGLMGSQIVKENGRLKFLVDILFGVKFSMNGTFEKSDTNVYDVTMDDGAILIGPYGLPVELVKSFKLEVLYSDDKIRITRGYSKILFVHIRVDR